MLKLQILLAAMMTLLMVATASEAYTSLVIDARGLGVMPGMSPKIVDTQGHEIFGTVQSIDPDQISEDGLVAYADDVLTARETETAGDKPLVVKAVAKGSNPSQTSVVVRTNDAEDILNANYASNILDDRKVIIVL